MEVPFLIDEVNNYRWTFKRSEYNCNAEELGLEACNFILFFKAANVSDGSPAITHCVIFCGESAIEEVSKPFSPVNYLQILKTDLHF